MFGNKPLAIIHDILCPFLADERERSEGWDIGGVGIDPIGQLICTRGIFKLWIGNVSRIEDESDDQVDAGKSKQTNDRAALRDGPELLHGFLARAKPSRNS